MSLKGLLSRLASALFCVVPWLVSMKWGCSHLLCGWHQECGHFDLPACPVQQLGSRHEVLCLATSA